MARHGLKAAPVSRSMVYTGFMPQLLDEISPSRLQEQESAAAPETRPEERSRLQRLTDQVKQKFAPDKKSTDQKFMIGWQDITSNHERIITEFQSAFELLREVYKNLEINTTLFENFMDTPLNYTLELAHEWYINPNIPLDRKHERWNSLRQLIEETRSFHDTYKAFKIALRSGQENQIRGIDFESRYLGLGQDRFWFIFPKDLDQDKFNKVKDIIFRTWGIFRQSRDTQTITILISDLEVVKNHLNSYTQMRQNPEMILEIGNSKFEELVVHETIHAVFGSETGDPHSLDFAEGCANRLIEIVLNNKKFEPKDETIQVMLQSFLGKTNKTPRSSTQILNDVRSNNLGGVTELRGSLPYAYGYILMDSLLANHKFQDLWAEWNQQHAEAKKYSFLLYVNKLFNEEAHNITNAGQFSHRLLLTRVMRQRLGFTEDEFTGLLHQIKSRVLSAAKT